MHGYGILVPKEDSSIVIKSVRMNFKSFLYILRPRHVFECFVKFRQ